MSARCIMRGAQKIIGDSVREAVEGLVFAVSIRILLMALRAMLTPLGAPVEILGILEASLALLAVVTGVVSSL